MLTVYYLENLTECSANCLKNCDSYSVNHLKCIPSLERFNVNITMCTPEPEDAQPKHAHPKHAQAVHAHVMHVTKEEKRQMNRVFIVWRWHKETEHN